MRNDSRKTPEVKMIEVDGVEYQLIDGRLYRYADITLDKGFKIVFGRIGSEDVLINMLNRLLGTKIRRLEYRNTEHPGMTEDERFSRFDVYCEDEKAVSKSVPWISTYRYSDVDTKDELGDGTNIVFIDLHGFSKSIEECTSLEDMWMYSIKNMRELTSCPDSAKGTEIEDLYRKSELAKMTYEQRKRIEEDIMTQNDILNSIREQLEDAMAEGREEGLAAGRAEGLVAGRAEGLEQGLKQGLEQGRSAARKELVMKMLAAGIAVEQVAMIAEMSLDDVLKLR